MSSTWGPKAPFNASKHPFRHVSGWKARGQKPNLRALPFHQSFGSVSRMNRHFVHRNNRITFGISIRMRSFGYVEPQRFSRSHWNAIKASSSTSLYLFHRSPNLTDKLLTRNIWWMLLSVEHPLVSVIKQRCKMWATHPWKDLSEDSIIDFRHFFDIWQHIFLANCDFWKRSYQENFMPAN